MPLEIFPAEYPAWLSEFSQRWIKRLSLHEWEIRFEIRAVMAASNGDGNAEAQCQQWPLLNRCDIRLRSDVEDTFDWRVNIIHELLHAKHARIDRFLDNVVFPETGHLTESAMKRGYNDVYESYIEGLAVALYQAFELIDYPKAKETTDGE